jgi:hypothetical protein
VRLKLSFSSLPHTSRNLNPIKLHMHFLARARYSILVLLWVLWILKITI